MAGCRSGTEAEILKEGLSSSQVMDFLAYGEMSFTNLMQESYTYGFSNWGITLHSKSEQAVQTVAEKQSTEVIESVPHRIATGHLILDKLLMGGIPENFAVALTAPSGAERDSLILSFLKKGTELNEITFFVTANPDKTVVLAESYANFHLFVCNPQAAPTIKDLPNVIKLKGVENLTDISIALTSAIRKLDPSLGCARRICLDLVSDILLQHHVVQTRRWLTVLMTELKSSGFTTLAVIDPQIHPSERLYAVLGLFEDEISIYEGETDKGLRRYLKIKKMSNQKYLEGGLPLKKQQL
jgi:KaiC/GvpD/RAD55 family RecA-like ATPase